MRVSTKKNEEDIRRELFGPLQVSSTSLYNPGLPDSPGWCELSELRLMMLIIKYKPAGAARHFNVMAIVDFMSHIYDTEPAEVEMFLNDEDRISFRRQQRAVQKESARKEKTIRRVIYSPKYTIRPTAKQVRDKVAELYDMRVVERNESLPDGFDTLVDFFLPFGDYSEMIRNKEDSNTAPATKRRRVATPDV
ncbi:unnamed protein product [Caenorhabditis auriculariae]|uniref:Uncharacterized protein n=1 Tax=Caenorhabditis auriculariae TaxID=2777116 RepID=A0A8S1HTK8_9PELO|nr:unnamed protein product [Caenorhabditis auriculariae]